MSDIDPHYFLHILLMILLWVSPVWVPLCALGLLQQFAPRLGDNLLAYLVHYLGRVRVGERLAGFRDRKLPTDDWGTE